jgi:hypothetical protein
MGRSHVLEEVLEKVSFLLVMEWLQLPAMLWSLHVLKFDVIQKIHPACIRMEPEVSRSVRSSSGCVYLAYLGLILALFLVWQVGVELGFEAGYVEVEFLMLADLVV